MTNEELNTALYKKVFAEQEKYREWLLSQPPDEILNHCYEYTVREDIVLALEEYDLSDKQCKALLKSPSPLADIYAFDLNVFRKNRTEFQRTQPLSESSCDDGTEQGESMSALLKKFSSALSVCDKYSFQSDPRFAWVDEMENDELYRKIISLPKRDMDLLTLIAFEGYSQREVAEIRGIAPAAICKKIAKLKKLLYGG